MHLMLVTLKYLLLQMIGKLFVNNLQIAKYIIKASQIITNK